MTGLSTPRSVYGVQTFAPYSRTSGAYYGILKVIDSGSISLAGKNVDLYGGSNKYPWASETGEIQSEISLKLGQLEDFMFALFLAKAPTANGPYATGNVGALVAVVGTLVSATTGIATIAATSGSEGSLKFGKYVAIATASHKIKIYSSTDADFNRGTPAIYQDDTLLAAAEITLADTSSAIVVPSLGLTVTGGSGTLAMNIGDAVRFEVMPISVKSSTVVVGGSTDIFPEFGAIIMAQHRGSDEMFEIDAFRCKAAGMPIGFDMFAWQKIDLKAIMLYDTAKNGVFEMRYVAPVAV